MKAEAYFVFESDKKKLIPDIYQSLFPETGESISDRSVISLKLEEGSLVLKIVSSDIISLRSALNTWLRLIQTAYDVAAAAV
jgi:KEOPS complex subunit Pcc1